MRRLCILALIAIGVFLAPVSPAATLTVDLHGGADYTDIQSAIDAAANGDTVLVKPGEYVITEAINFNRLHDPENPASPPVKNIVLKSEGGAEVTTIRMAPPEGKAASVVSFGSGETGQSLLEGLRLTGGNSSGVACSGSSPTLTNCTISVNSGVSGGGLYCEESSPTLTNCTISGNSCTGWGAAGPSGGGVACFSSSPTLTNCIITENSATFDLWWQGFGGGLGCFDGAPVLTNCTISGNMAGSGGGLYCFDGAPVLTKCTISGNTALVDGGGVCCVDGTTLTSCTISGNTALVDGGGVFCGTGTTLTSCTISGNDARNTTRRACGGVYCGEGYVTLTNCAIWGNSGDGLCYFAWNAATNCTISGNAGDVVLPGWDPPPTTNCIVWGNAEGSEGEDPLFVNNGVFDFQRYKTLIIQGSQYQVPDFVVEAPDYHLQPGSPCIDAGTLEGAPSTDIEGNARPCGAGVDIGAYEFGDCPPSTERFRRGDVDGNGELQITDPIKALGFLFLGEDAPGCLDAADVDDDDNVNITDAVYSLSFLFLGGPAPAAPFGECGVDPTLDELDCAAFAPCGTGG